MGQKINYRKAHKVKVPGLNTIMGYILPNRTECEVFLHETIDATELVKWLEVKNASHPEYKTTIFHAIITIVARMVRERPQLNYYMKGYSMYEREAISLSFVCKRRFADGAEESLMVLVPSDEDTLDTVSRKIVGDVRETRKSEHSTGGIDGVIDAFAKVPKPLLMLVVRIIRWLDFWGLNFDAIMEGDPNYTSVLLSNLGSIKCPAVYHHLNNYGTNSVMITVGELHKEEILMDDGTKQIRDCIDIGVTLDERIGDGFYFAKSLKLLKHILRNPELLDRALGEPSGFDYK